ncbi:MAG: CHAT domain-containing protein [Pseudomonadota bacterium]|nr:CHAT domain-containing protein [Gammaproteobacteria bacterium]MDQ3580535.1 CHAT domain-containing protein [Pseudomonadota bacterium]
MGKIKDKIEDRLNDIKAILTVMPDANLEKIREVCAWTEYTHVHILAHGAPFEEAGDNRYGIALCSDTQQAQGDVVDGERLAIALSSWDSSGRAKYRPTVVTLATCDSGNINSALTGAASPTNFTPRAFLGSLRRSSRSGCARLLAAEVLYSGLLSGADRRWVLYELRQRLRTDSPGTHDWASIVAYALGLREAGRRVPRSASAPKVERKIRPH